MTNLFDPAHFIRNESDSLSKQVFSTCICGICYQILNKAQSCRNGHACCQDCIVKSISSSGKKCPICKIDLDQTLLMIPTIDRMIASFDVKCIHESKGCEWIGAFGNFGENLSNHLKSCAEETQSCRNTNCAEKIARKDLIQHERETCAFRPLICSHCNQFSCTDAQALEQHIEKVCIVIPILCPNRCDPKLRWTRKDLISHLEICGKDPGVEDEKRYRKLHTKVEALILSSTCFRGYTTTIPKDLLHLVCLPQTNKGKNQIWYASCGSQGGSYSRSLLKFSRTGFQSTILNSRRFDLSIIRGMAIHPSTAEVLISCSEENKIYFCSSDSLVPQSSLSLSGNFPTGLHVAPVCLLVDNKEQPEIEDWLFVGDQKNFRVQAFCLATEKPIYRQTYILPEDCLVWAVGVHPISKKLLVGCTHRIKNNFITPPAIEIILFGFDLASAERMEIIKRIYPFIEEDKGLSLAISKDNMIRLSIPGTSTWILSNDLELVREMTSSESISCIQYNSFAFSSDSSEKEILQATREGKMEIFPY